MTGQLHLGDLAPEKTAALSQWHTPPRLAEKMVAWAGVAGLSVLEPSAGGGALVEPLLRAGAHVTAVEIDEAWLPELKRRCPDATLVHGDYLRTRLPTHFDCGVANTPFENEQDALFCAQMVRDCTRAVVLLRAHALHGAKRFDLCWGRVTIRRLAVLVRRPSFGGEYGAMHEYVVAEIAGAPMGLRLPSGTVEHWTERWT